MDNIEYKGYWLDVSTAFGELLDEVERGLDTVKASGRYEFSKAMRVAPPSPPRIMMGRPGGGRYEVGGAPYPEYPGELHFTISMCVVVCSWGYEVWMPYGYFEEGEKVFPLGRGFEEKVTLSGKRIVYRRV